MSTAQPLAQKPRLDCRRGGSSIRAPSRERASAASVAALALTANPIPIRIGTTSGVIANRPITIQAVTGIPATPRSARAG